MNQPSSIAIISVVIPTFQREEVLLDTLQYLLNQVPIVPEIVVVDQSPAHEPATDARLTELNQQGLIRWVRLVEPSIPKSMNHGLRVASLPIVLFLDDDISASTELVAAHADAHAAFPDATAVVGQVLQPGESPRAVSPSGPRSGLCGDLAFPFFSTESQWVTNVMAGNLSVNRELALKMGGFDENFTGVAYRYETDFARRIIESGGKIRFYPEASIHHLRVSRGGTRATGDHLTSADPKHGIGDYYYAFRHGRWFEAWRYSLRRVFREVRTKFHLRHPWWIPVKLLGELRALHRGRRLALSQEFVRSTR